MTEELTGFSVGLPSSSINLVFIVCEPSSILVHNIGDIKRGDEIEMKKWITTLTLVLMV